MRSGRVERLPYSLSRWTDLPAAKWPWFQAMLDQGSMVGIDPRTGLPDRWSLAREDTMGLIFWTRNSRNLIVNADRLKTAYADPKTGQVPIVVHFTLTGWHEVEKGAPNLGEGLALLQDTVAAFGAQNVTWRFSPVPMVSDVVERFEIIARKAADMGLREVFVSFLQENDRVPETRAPRVRSETLKLLAGRAHGLKVLLCNEDRTLDLRGVTNLDRGICESGKRFIQTDYQIDGPKTEGCGCSLAVDPFTVNETCSMGCAYCLDPSTPILYSDMVWRPIGEARVGDRLIGFDEFPIGRGRGGRRMRESVIEGVSVSKQPTIRLVTDHSDVLTTANHGWINDRGRWVSTRGIRGHLRQIGHVKDLAFTEPYKLGYLAGMTLGDGTMRFESGWRSDKLGFPQAYWRIALQDEEPLGRLVAYLASFGIEANVRPFSTPGMQKVEIRALGKLEKIAGLLSSQPDLPDYRRGFLAGFYDAEGSVEADGGNIRVSQKDRAVLDRVSSYASSLGFNFNPEVHSEARLVGTARLEGTLRERMRFISTIRPALARKSPDWQNREFEAEADPIRCKEDGPVQDVVDIQTSTHTFFAGGLATHNCYAADKTLSPKKRNTTRLRVVS